MKLQLTLILAATMVTPALAGAQQVRKGIVVENCGSISGALHFVISLKKVRPGKPLPTPRLHFSLDGAPGPLPNTWTLDKPADRAVLTASRCENSRPCDGAVSGTFRLDGLDAAGAFGAYDMVFAGNSREAGRFRVRRIPRDPKLGNCE